MLALTETRAGRDRVFLTPDQLVTELGLPGAAVPLFTLDDWDQPHTTTDHDNYRPPRPTDSVDLVLAIRAVHERRRISGPVSGRTRDSHLHDRIREVGGSGGW